jgi:fatty-acyl-CoA synthase
METAGFLYDGLDDVFAKLAHPDFKQDDLSSLRIGIMAGPLRPPELMRKVQTEMHLVEMEIGYYMAK